MQTLIQSLSSFLPDKTPATLTRQDARRGKNNESLRQVPLHPQLIDLGFLDYVEAIKASGQERLWPSLKTGGTHKTDSEVLGRWFNRYIHQKLGFPDNVVFHSFRHTFKDLCRNAHIPKDAHHQLTGHASSDTGDRYGEGFALEVLHEDIKRIRLPFTILRPLPFTGRTLASKAAAGHPHLVPLDQIQRTRSQRVRNRRTLPLVPPNPLPTLRSHQALYGTTGHRQDLADGLDPLN